MAFDVVTTRPSRSIPRLGLRVSWGAIFSGSFVTVSLFFLFMILGGALGFPSLDVLDPIPLEDWSDWAPLPHRSAILGGIFYTIASSISYLIGGFCTSKIGQVDGKLRSALYGFVSWAVVVVMTITLGSLFSPALPDLISGMAPPAAGWFLFGVLLIGCLTSCWGGFLGRSRYVFFDYPEILLQGADREEKKLKSQSIKSAS